MMEKLRKDIRAIFDAGLQRQTRVTRCDTG